MIHKRSYCWVISSRGFTAPQIEAPASDVIDWRRRIHAHPELSYKEHATSDFVVETLPSFGLSPERPTETSVTVLIQGRRPGSTVALRADLDALPLQRRPGTPSPPR